MLVEVSWLKERLGDAQVVVVDARKGWEYRRGHIPGAIHLDTFGYVNVSTGAEGLRRIQEDWGRMFGEAGIAPEDVVVFYDGGTTNRSPRGTVMLRYLGHRRAYVLHGGFAGWLAAGGEVSRGPGSRRARPGALYPVRPDATLVATADEVAAVLGRGEVALLDVREGPEYTGRRRLQWNPRMGRIPGAGGLCWRELLDDELGRFREPEAMQGLLAQRGVTPDKEVIVYCQRAHRASNTYAALKALGYRRCRVYIGSWYDWSRRRDLPLERG
ncbi:MAG: sulfurtransferase [Dehalococcoidia bacterium]